MNQAKDLPFLRYRDFSLLLMGRLLSSVAMLTQSVTLGQKETKEINFTFKGPAATATNNN